MSELAIRVEGLGKKYKIGAPRATDLRNAFGKFISRLRKAEPPGRYPLQSGPSGDFWALRDINFEVRKGQALGIIGRNGAGKSTLLKILSRITEPTEGWFTLDGRLSSLLEVGTGFHMELTGRENVYLNGTILGMKRREIRDKFDEIVDFSGIEKFIDTPVKHYSSGMKVRLAFSVAAHLEPEILLIDEVLAVGDADFQKKCLGKMEDVTGQGRTVLFVSHNMGAVQSLCDHGIMLIDGKIGSMDRVDAVIQRYLKKGMPGEFSDRARHRKGAGNVMVTGIHFYDANLREIDDVISGQTLNISITYDSDQTQIRNVIVGLVITNAHGQFLAVLNNKMSNFNFDILPGKGELRCKIKKLPLMSGIHYMNVNLFVNGINEDYIEAARRFNVENADYYSSGFPNAFNRQGIYIEQEWKSC